MIPSIEEHRAELAELCRRHHVLRLSLFGSSTRDDFFGSATRDDFDPQRSDLDFLVDFEPLLPGEHADAYFGLLEDLASLFDRSIDLVELSTLRNPYRRQEIEATQVLLHAAA